MADGVAAEVAGLDPEKSRSVAAAPRTLKKRTVLAAIVGQLTADLEAYIASAKSAHAEATDEQSKAENKYDTRGLEASYLAHAQSQQAVEIQEAIREFESLPVLDSTRIEVGSLVALDGTDGPALYFIGPRAGGLEISVKGTVVTVITPTSPLGQQLAGKTAGESVTLRQRQWRIARVL